ncbi:hypothetical protein [Anabaena catenula]|uniref:hypothetical protein n=1 Tax=Anabaena catenula TaxID=1296320 RepID=UPI001F54F206|nr:hypothetical protein [Anabaena catenula]
MQGFRIDSPDNSPCSVPSSIGHRVIIMVFKAIFLRILSLLTCVMVQEILYGKEMMPLSRDRI